MMRESTGVMLAHVGSYDKSAIKESIDRGAILPGVPRQFNGKTVLLKPNLISARAPALACTDGRFICAAAEWFIDCGARVVIGDSPAFGSADAVLKRHGIDGAIAHLDVSVQPFRTVRKTTLSHGVSIGVAEEALACDFFVNMPKIKAHSQMYLTAGVKNLFGIVIGMRKAVAHMSNGSSHLRFAHLMLDLVELLPETLTIADGIVAMHRDGPVSGEPLQLGCVAMSVDPVALDTALLELLELDSGCCPVYRAAQERLLPGSYMENIRFEQCSPADFQPSGFIAPQTLNPVPFNPLRFVSSLGKRLMLKAVG
ncbi:MAG: DUF362 domain-containing protein [Desulfocapsaceae bacterium]|jgi:uncharacterized protein (DUF362 family)|nr:DUF362 domain-containing protein [Desulfocapsaceae bacterium]